MSAMTAVRDARHERPERASAVLQLARGREEEGRLGRVFAAAVGVQAQEAAEVSLCEARACVAAREEWLHWIDEGESIAPWADGEWATEHAAGQRLQQRDTGHEILRGSRHDDDPAARDASASDRDRTSAERDRAASVRDRLAQAHDEGLVARDDDERRAAREQRVAAALDREHARRDRQLAARDRALAAADYATAGEDDLTGALRRGVGLAAVQRELERAHRADERLVVAFVDLDGLKSVNDASGHAAGDRLLERAAKLIIEHLRPYDVVVRVGGDEFVCSLSGIDLEAVRERFRLISADLARGPDPGSISVGLEQRMAGDSVDDVVNRADAALATTKRARSSRPPPMPSPSSRACRERNHAERPRRETRAVTRVLAAQPAAAAEARHATLQLRLPQRVRETLELLVSELVANSVRHAGLPVGATLKLDITHETGRVRLAVHDSGIGFDPLQLRDTEPLACDGRGLAIIAALSDAWGVERAADGCTVWCEVVDEVPAATI
jgi:diguanylate cyclase (GGDEF)-like protein